MAFSMPQLKSRTKFSPLPQEEDIKRGQPNPNPNSVDKCFFTVLWEWEGFTVVLRFLLVAPLILLLTLRQRHNKPVSNPIPPKIFLDSLVIPPFKVADGEDELPATWDVKLMISNVMNATNINVQQLEATVLYKHNEALPSMFTPIKPQVFPVVEAMENKMIDLKFSSRGWEKNQPEAVVDAMAKDRRMGVMRFDILMRVNGDFEFQGRAIPFLMSTNCTDLVIQFPSSTEPSQAPTLIHGNHTECLGVTKWGHITYNYADMY